MGFMRRFSRNVLGTKPPPRGHPGARAYGVGDIHGRLDLLEQMLAEIEADARGRPEKKTYIVFLGDLIDRGQDSAAVLERLRTYSPAFATPIFIAGNHEEVFLRVLGGESEILKDWLSFGGAECVQSYGIDPDSLARLDAAEAVRKLRNAVPTAHTEFVGSFADTFRFGDYLFVHAGIRPGIELLDQDQFDLRWIRQPFLSDEEEHGLVVVHGHTIVPEVEERANRIGIDTGAYQTGVLTTLGIEDENRWYLSTSDEEVPASVATA